MKLEREIEKINSANMVTTTLTTRPRHTTYAHRHTATQAILSTTHTTNLIPHYHYAQDAAVALTCLAGAKLWVNLWSHLAASDRLPANLSRKLIHAGSAPLFLLFWPLYSDDASARIAAGLVPLLQIVRLYRAGQADSTDEEALVRAVSRSGQRAETLGGPLLYSAVLFFATVVGWRSVAAAVAVCQMAVGDGVADIFGRRYGTVKWPFAPAKSLVGSAAFVAGAWAASVAMVALFSACGYTTLGVVDCVAPLFFISVLSALAELAPVWDDNLSVPLVAALASAAVLRG